MPPGGKLTSKKRAAPAKQLSTVANDLQQLQIKEAMGKIMTILRDSPEQVLPCLHALETKFFEKKEVGAQAPDWPSTYMRCDQIPKYWLAALLRELEPELTEERIRNIDQYDKDNIRRLAEYATGMRPMQKLPRPCLTKAVLKMTLTKSYSALGRRLANGWVAESIDMEGKIDWASCGVFSLQEAADCSGLAKEVNHVSGAKAQGSEICEVMWCMVWYVGSISFNSETLGFNIGVSNVIP
jgi:hypothetical protein